MTNSEGLHKIMNMRCSHHTKHAWSKQTHADIFFVNLRRRPVQQILKMERLNLVQHVLQQATLSQASTADSKNSSKRDEAILSVLPASERRKLELSIRNLHHNLWSSLQSYACANVAMERYQGECAGCSQITPLQCLRRGQATRCETHVSFSREQRTLESRRL